MSKRVLTSREKRIKKKLKNTKDENNPFDNVKQKRKFSIMGQKNIQHVSLAKSRSKGVKRRRETLLKDLYSLRNEPKKFNQESEKKNQQELIEKIKRQEARLNKRVKFSLEKPEGESSLYKNQSLGENILPEESDLMDIHALRKKRRIENENFDKIKNLSNLEKYKETHHVETPRTEREIYREVIAKSKLHKFERQKKKAEVEDMVDELNEEFDEINDLLKNNQGVEQIKKNEKEDDYEEYEALVNSLANDKRAVPIRKGVKETKEKVLENERLSRMKGDDTESELKVVLKKKESADSLEENFVIDDEYIVHSDEDDEEGENIEKKKKKKKK